jgi:hypothetical protein
MITEYGSGQKESGIIVLFLGEILAVAFGRALQVMLFTGMFVLWEIWKLIMIVKAFMLPREQADEFMEEARFGAPLMGILVVFRKNFQKEKRKNSLIRRNT